MQGSWKKALHFWHIFKVFFGGKMKVLGWYYWNILASESKFWVECFSDKWGIQSNYCHLVFTSYKSPYVIGLSLFFHSFRWSQNLWFLCQSTSFLLHLLFILILGFFCLLLNWLLFLNHLHLVVLFVTCRHHLLFLLLLVNESWHCWVEMLLGVGLHWVELTACIRSPSFLLSSRSFHFLNLALIFLMSLEVFVKMLLLQDGLLVEKPLCKGVIFPFNALGFASAHTHIQTGGLEHARHRLTVSLFGLRFSCWHTWPFSIRNLY